MPHREFSITQDRWVPLTPDAKAALSHRLSEIGVRSGVSPEGPDTVTVEYECVSATLKLVLDERDARTLVHKLVRYFGPEKMLEGYEYPTRVEWRVIGKDPNTFG